MMMVCGEATAYPVCVPVADPSLSLGNFSVPVCRTFVTAVLGEIEEKAPNALTERWAAFRSISRTNRGNFSGEPTPHGSIGFFERILLDQRLQ